MRSTHTTDNTRSTGSTGSTDSPETSDSAGSAVMLPTMWNTDGHGENFRPRYGYGSYTLTIRSYPKDGWIVYIPNVDAAYRVYLNGTLTASSGNASRDGAAVVIDDEVIKNILTLPETENVQVVIEASTKYDPVLNSAPILVRASQDALRTSIRYAVAGMYLGVYIIILVLYLFLLFSHDRSMASPWLLLLSAIMLLIIFRSGEIGATARLFMPLTESREYYFFTTVLSNLTPILMLCSAADLLKQTLLKGERIFLAALVFVCLAGQYLLPFGILGNYTVLFRAVGFLPALLAVSMIGKAVYAGKPYALYFAAGYIALLSGIVTSACMFLGMYIFNMAIYLPTCFVLFSISLIIVYVKRNLVSQRMERQMQAQELENTRLQIKVKESEGLLMLSQIRPHFIYNALIAIYNLNAENPAKAGEAILTFARYMRVNMRLIGSSEPITFSEELNHIRNYAAIEKLRFEDRLRIEYHIECEDFVLPPLTVQPLVENAIKHGVCKKLEGGTVKLSACRRSQKVIIRVEDDGIGFDTSILESDQSESLGIRSISRRLALISAGTLRIESTPGRGTCATVILDETHLDSTPAAEDRKGPHKTA